MKIGIIVPVRNCLAMTQAAVASIKTQHQYQVIIVDDRSDQSMKDWLRSTPDIASIIDPPSSGLAANWNLGIAMARDLDCTYFLVANNDILFHPQTIDNLVARMERGDIVMATGVNVQGLCPRPEDIFSLELGEDTETEHPDFSCFMINTTTLEKIGTFDENYIGAYFEDGDYHARIALLGERAVTINRAPYYHYASQTMSQNPHLADDIQAKFRTNEQYFVRKWGRMPVGDVPVMRQLYFKTPFNDPNKSPKEW